MARIPIRIRPIGRAITAIKQQYPMINKTIDDVSNQGKLTISIGDLGITDPTYFLQNTTVPFIANTDSINVTIRSRTDASYCKHHVYYLRKEPEVDTSKVFTFYINPQQMSPSYRKLITESRSRAGWIIQHWGNALTDYKISGVFGGMQPPNGVALQDWNIQNSEAFKNMVQLKQLYYNKDFQYNTNNLEALSNVTLELVLADKVVIGYFVDFNGPETSAEKPFLYSYSFTFRSYKELDFSTPSSLGAESVPTYEETIDYA